MSDAEGRQTAPAGVASKLRMEGMMKRSCLVAVIVASLAGSVVSAQAQAPTVYKPGTGIVAPKVVTEVKPGYTADALRAGVNGVVIMQCVVLADGTVGDVEVTRSLDAGLDAEAVKTVKQWRFAPGTKDGSPVPVSVEIEMTFSTVRSPRVDSAGLAKPGDEVVAPIRGPRVDSPGLAKPGDGVSAPRLTKEYKPNYTPAARASGITGLIEMECVVLTDGTVGDVSVTKPLDPELDAEAVRTLRQWTFAPGTKDGEPVPVQVMVQMSFTLR